jgi:hypothetical protein
MRSIAQPVERQNPSRIAKHEGLSIAEWPGAAGAGRGGFADGDAMVFLQDRMQGDRTE